MLYYIRYIRIRLDVFSQKKKEKKKNQIRCSNMHLVNIRAFTLSKVNGI